MNYLTINGKVSLKGRVDFMILYPVPMQQEEDMFDDYLMEKEYGEED